MKQITLNIQDINYKFFIELIKKFDFVQIQTNESSKIQTWQKKIVLDRINNHQETQDAFKMIQELENEQ